MSAPKYTIVEDDFLAPRTAGTDPRDAEIAALRRQLADALEWQPIETAPKGYPSLGDPSEWFLACGNPGPKDARVAVIRRVFHSGYGPWQCTGDACYRDDFFTHWMPLPELARKGATE